MAAAEPAVAKARLSWLQVPVHSRRRVLVLVLNADGRRQVRFPKNARLWRKAGRASVQRMSPRRGASVKGRIRNCANCALPRFNHESYSAKMSRKAARCLKTRTLES